MASLHFSFSILIIYKYTKVGKEFFRVDCSSVLKGKTGKLKISLDTDKNISMYYLTVLNSLQFGSLLMTLDNTLNKLSTLIDALDTNCMLPKGWRCRSETFFHLRIPVMKCSLQWTWNNRITKGKTLLWQQNISILSELSVRKEATVWFKQKQTLQNKKCNHDFKTKSQFSPICDGISTCNSLFSGIFWAYRNTEQCFMALETETGVKWANLRRHSSFLTKLDTECSWFRI